MLLLGGSSLTSDASRCSLGASSSTDLRQWTVEPTSNAFLFGLLERRAQVLLYKGMRSQRCQRRLGRPETDVQDFGVPQGTPNTPCASPSLAKTCMIRPRFSFGGGWLLGP